MMLSVLFSAWVVSGFPADEGLVAPLAVITSEGGASVGVEGAKVKVSCRVYPHWVVVEHNDPGLRGAALVEARERAPGDTPRAACAATTPATKLVSAEDDVYVRGFVGGFVVFRGADSFGLAHPLLVVDARTGARVWDARDAASSPARFRARGDVISVEFARVVASDCADAASCLARARDDGKAGDDVKLTPARSCAKAVAPIQVTVPVRVDDLRTPSARLVSGVAACAVTP